MKILEFLSEVVGWVLIFISPTSIGFFLGFAIFNSMPNLLGTMLGAFLAILSVMIGIYLANKAWKGTGTINFLSRISASGANTSGDAELNYQTAVGANASATGTNATAIGAGAIVNENDKVRLGDANVLVVEGQVAYSYPSDAI